MNEEQTVKMTELDYLTAAPHLQMIKAALPYINLSEQRFVSLFVKINELQRTMELFQEKESGMVSICSLEEDEPSSPLDMLNAMKPYGTDSEQEFIDLIINFLQSSRIYQSYRDATDLPEDLQYIRKPQPEERVNSQSTPRPAPRSTSQPGNGGRNQQGNRGNQSASQRRNEHPHIPIDQLKNILPPEQQQKLETAQFLMQTFQQFS